jgi:hypothetical protein
MVDKVSTTAKMDGGNQTELYQGNSHDKKVLKARSLEEMWPEHVETVIRFNRPHHYVNWKKHFKTPLIRRSDVDWDSMKKVDEKGFKLTKKADIKSEDIKKIQKDFNS